MRSLSMDELENIQDYIHVIQGHRVMLDRGLRSQNITLNEPCAQLDAISTAQFTF